MSAIFFGEGNCGIMAESYRMYRGDTLLGTLSEEAPDFPWATGTFQPTPAFAQVKSLFEEELKLLSEKKWEEWQSVWDQIDALGICLKASIPHGEVITKFIVHFKGDRFDLKY